MSLARIVFYFLQKFYVCCPRALAKALLALPPDVLSLIILLPRLLVLVQELFVSATVTAIFLVRTQLELHFFTLPPVYANAGTRFLDDRERCGHVNVSECPSQQPGDAECSCPLTKLPCELASISRPRGSSLLQQLDLPATAGALALPGVCVRPSAAHAPLVVLPREIFSLLLPNACCGAGSLFRVLRRVERDRQHTPQTIEDLGSRKRLRD